MKKIKFVIFLFFLWMKCQEILALSPEKQGAAGSLHLSCSLGGNSACALSCRLWQNTNSGRCVRGGWALWKQCECENRKNYEYLLNTIRINLLQKLSLYRNTGMLLDWVTNLFSRKDSLSFPIIDSSTIYDLLEALKPHVKFDLEFYKKLFSALFMSFPDISDNEIEAAAVRMSKNGESKNKAEIVKDLNDILKSNLNETSFSYDPENVEKLLDEYLPFIQKENAKNEGTFNSSQTTKSLADLVSSDFLSRIWHIPGTTMNLIKNVFSKIWPDKFENSGNDLEVPLTREYIKVLMNILTSQPNYSPSDTQLDHIIENIKTSMKIDQVLPLTDSNLIRLIGIISNDKVQPDNISKEGNIIKDELDSNINTRLLTTRDVRDYEFQPTKAKTSNIQLREVGPLRIKNAPMETRSLIPTNSHATGATINLKPRLSIKRQTDGSNNPDSIKDTSSDSDRTNISLTAKRTNKGLTIRDTVEETEPNPGKTNVNLLIRAWGTPKRLNSDEPIVENIKSVDTSNSKGIFNLTGREVEPIRIENAPTETRSLIPTNATGATINLKPRPSMKRQTDGSNNLDNINDTSSDSDRTNISLTAKRTNKGLTIRDTVEETEPDPGKTNVNLLVRAWGTPKRLNSDVPIVGDIKSVDTSNLKVIINLTDSSTVKYNLQGKPTTPSEHENTTGKESDSTDTEPDLRGTNEGLNARLQNPNQRNLKAPENYFSVPMHTTISKDTIKGKLLLPLTIKSTNKGPTIRDTLEETEPDPDKTDVNLHVRPRETPKRLNSDDPIVGDTKSVDTSNSKVIINLTDSSTVKHNLHGEPTTPSAHENTTGKEGDSTDTQPDVRGTNEGLNARLQNPNQRNLKAPENYFSVPMDTTKSRDTIKLNLHGEPTTPSMDEENTTGKDRSTIKHDLLGEPTTPSAHENTTVKEGDSTETQPDLHGTNVSLNAREQYPEQINLNAPNNNGIKPMDTTESNDIINLTKNTDTDPSHQSQGSWRKESASPQRTNPNYHKARSNLPLRSSNSSPLGQSKSHSRKWSSGQNKLPEDTASIGNKGTKPDVSKNDKALQSKLLKPLSNAQMKQPRETASVGNQIKEPKETASVDTPSTHENTTGKEGDSTDTQPDLNGTNISPLARLQNTKQGNLKVPNNDISKPKDKTKLKDIIELTDRPIKRKLQGEPTSPSAHENTTVKEGDSTETQPDLHETNISLNAREQYPEQINLNAPNNNDIEPMDTTESNDIINSTKNTDTDPSHQSQGSWRKESASPQRTNPNYDKARWNLPLRSSNSSPLSQSQSYSRKWSPGQNKLPKDTASIGNNKGTKPDVSKNDKALQSQLLKPLSNAQMKQPREIASFGNQIKKSKETASVNNHEDTKPTEGIKIPNVSKNDRAMKNNISEQFKTGRTQSRKKATIPTGPKQRRTTATSPKQRKKISTGPTQSYPIQTEDRTTLPTIPNQPGNTNKLSLNRLTNAPNNNGIEFMNTIKSNDIINLTKNTDTDPYHQSQGSWRKENTSPQRTNPNYDKAHSNLPLRSSNSSPLSQSQSNSRKWSSGQNELPKDTASIGNNKGTKPDVSKNDNALQSKLLKSFSNAQMKQPSETASFGNQIKEPKETASVNNHEGTKPDVVKNDIAKQNNPLIDLKPVNTHSSGQNQQPNETASIDNHEGTKPNEGIEIPNLSKNDEAMKNYILEQLKTKRTQSRKNATISTGPKQTRTIATSPKQRKKISTGPTQSYPIQTEDRTTLPTIPNQPANTNKLSLNRLTNAPNNNGIELMDTTKSNDIMNLTKNTDTDPYHQSQGSWRKENASPQRTNPNYDKAHSNLPLRSSNSSPLSQSQSYSRKLSSGQNKLPKDTASIGNNEGTNPDVSKNDKALQSQLLKPLSNAQMKQPREIASFGNQIKKSKETASVNNHEGTKPDVVKNNVAKQNNPLVDLKPVNTQSSGQNHELNETASIDNHEDTKPTEGIKIPNLSKNDRAMKNNISEQFKTGRTQSRKKATIPTGPKQRRTTATSPKQRKKISTGPTQSYPIQTEDRTTLPTIPNQPANTNKLSLNRLTNAPNNNGIELMDTTKSNDIMNLTKNTDTDPYHQSQGSWRKENASPQNQQPNETAFIDNHEGTKPNEGIKIPNLSKNDEAMKNYILEQLKTKRAQSRKNATIPTGPKQTRTIATSPKQRRTISTGPTQSYPIQTEDRTKLPTVPNQSVNTNTPIQPEERTTLPAVPNQPIKINASMKHENRTTLPTVPNQPAKINAQSTDDLQNQLNNAGNNNKGPSSVSLSRQTNSPEPQRKTSSTSEQRKQSNNGRSEPGQSRTVVDGPTQSEIVPVTRKGGSKTYFYISEDEDEEEEDGEEEMEEEEDEKSVGPK